MKRKQTSLQYAFNLLLKTLLAVCLALLFLGGYFTFLWARAFQHPVRNIPAGDILVAQQIPFEEIKLITRDGLELSAWYTPPQNGAVILAAHGYNGNRLENIHAMFARHGYGVLAWDFRAHGESEGDLCTLGYSEQMDVEAALEFALLQKGVEHVGAWGGSMGGSTVILSAATHPEIEAVIADSAFPALEDVLHLNMPIKSFQPLVMVWEYSSGADIDDVRPVDVIGEISPRPVFVIDSQAGSAAVANSLPPLYTAAQEPKQIWIETGVPHLGMFANDPAGYESRVIAFFNEYLISQ
ncbi:MAG TPA: alpha/beta fold hydrolase [Anaerolineales bacterium]|nr:alpha/beta fold hydrolase [Anaerolineales bacterium]